VTACTTPQPARYKVGHDRTERPEAAAQHSLLQQVLERQVNPPLDGPIRLLEAPLPPYPPALRRAKVEGEVRVRFQVLPDGTVGPAMVQGEPPPALANLALESLRQWRFAPMSRHGVPVAQWFEQPFKFQLAPAAPRLVPAAAP